ncbi:MAG: hypothetical protein KC414_09845, partial [Romboutsia sp.]|nr:hypothetical protein [Romboutsia sp.]
MPNYNPSCLISNRELYKICFNNIYINNTIYKCEENIQKISRLAKFASRNHTGLLSDPRLEKLLKEYGNNFEDVEPIIEKKKRRKVLHIATEVYNIGGHNRVIRNWIQNDWNSDSFLLLTNNLKREFPKYIESVSNINIKILEKNSILERAKELRKYVLKENFDNIILHIHPYDVIPNIAFSKPIPGIITFFNHADHIFSLGSTVADAIINFRENAKTFSIKYRNTKQSLVLNLTYETKGGGTNSNHSIPLKKEMIKLVTMAGHYKFRPIDNINFLHFFDNLTKKAGNIEFHVIGIDEKIFELFTGYSNTNPKIILHGYIIDPYHIYQDADYFIEPYPMGTCLGLLDVCSTGAYPIMNWIDYTIYGSSAFSIIPEE